MRNAILFFLLISLTVWAKGQKTTDTPTSAWYIEPEIMAGKVVGNFQHFPASPMQTTVFLNIGRISYSADNTWTGFYNYPSTGVGFSYSTFGNDSVFGREVGVVPFLEINTSRFNESSFSFKFGLGTSYFTTHYDKVKNPTNYAIGSHLTWAFQLFGYYKLNLSDNFNLKIGGGYLHSSNGHTKLPNYGLNSAMLSFSAQYFFSPIQPRREFEPDYTHHFLLTVRTGIGMHEYGAARGPAGGPLKPVYSLAVSGGILFKQNICLHAGFAYRFYQQYYNYIVQNKPVGYAGDPYRNSSNVYFFLGGEFLMGHVGIDIEGGLNLYKPFYVTYIKSFHEIPNWQKTTFPSRMGLKLYALDTSRKPQNNVYIAANINANFGQADFSELSLGFVHLLK